MKNIKLLEIMQKRHSVRKYTGHAVLDEYLKMVLQAGLLSASSRGRRPWELIVVRNKETLKQMSKGRASGSAKMLENAEAAVVVIANEELSDVWIEDCSIVMSNMHLMADSLGLGSCWIQGRLREAKEGETTEEYLREILDFPENYKLEAILSIGMPESHPVKQELDSLHTEKIHYERF